MGTRNLTMVIDQEGEVKVAQYGQWDGYPSGVGVGIVSFLKNETLFESFKKNVWHCAVDIKFINPNHKWGSLPTVTQVQC